MDNCGKAIVPLYVMNMIQLILITDLSILGAVVRISNVPLQISISSKIGSKHKLNHPKQERPFPDIYHWFVHIESCGENFKFPSLGPPQKSGLEASWMVSIKGGHPTCSWCPIIVSHNPNLKLQTWAGQPVKDGFHTRLANQFTMGITVWLACPYTMG